MQQEHEIEIKIMLKEANLPYIETLLAQQVGDALQTEWLENCYYDTPTQFFAHQKMGLRVRSKQGAFEMTLKTQGQIIGGLHSRPEYHLRLENAQPDFVGLVRHFGLPFNEPTAIQAELTPLFSTDFTRKSGLITFGQSQIEMALDQGRITTQHQSEPICELELELKNGNLADLLAFLETLPTRDGIWFSSLSKAERGYLLTDPERVVKKCQDLTACPLAAKTEAEKYQHMQKLADFICRMPEQNVLQQTYRALKGEDFNINNLESYLTSKAHFHEQIRDLKKHFLEASVTA